MMKIEVSKHSFERLLNGFTVELFIKNEDIKKQKQVLCGCSEGPNAVILADVKYNHILLGNHFFFVTAVFKTSPEKAPIPAGQRGVSV